MRQLQVLCNNEIRYRADEGSERAKELIKEVEEQIQRHNAMTGMSPCPYSYQFATKESVPVEKLVMPKIAESKKELLEIAKNCDLKKWAILFIIARLETGGWNWDNLEREHWKGINKQIDEEFTKLNNASNFSE